MDHWFDCHGGCEFGPSQVKDATHKMMCSQNWGMLPTGCDLAVIFKCLGHLVCVVSLFLEKALVDEVDWICRTVP